MFFWWFTYMDKNIIKDEPEPEDKIEDRSLSVPQCVQAFWHNSMLQFQSILLKIWLKLSETGASKNSGKVVTK